MLVIRLRILAVLFLVSLITPVLGASDGEDSVLCLAINPGIGIPLNSYLYDFGGGIRLGILVPIQPLPFLEPTAGIGYSLVPLQADVFVSFMRAVGGFGVMFKIGDVFRLHGSAEAGYFFSIVHRSGGAIGDGFYYGAGVGATFLTAPGFWVGLEFRYNDHLGLYREFEISLASRIIVVKRKSVGETRP